MIADGQHYYVPVPEHWLAQGLAEDNGVENDDTCEAIVCGACQQFHLVNPAR